MQTNSRLQVTDFMILHTHPRPYFFFKYIFYPEKPSELNWVWFPTHLKSQHSGGGGWRVRNSRSSSASLGYRKPYF